MKTGRAKRVGWVAANAARVQIGCRVCGFRVTRSYAPTVSVAEQFGIVQRLHGMYMLCGTSNDMYRKEVVWDGTHHSWLEADVETSP